MKERSVIYRKAINDILEKMAFMFSEDAEKDDIIFPIGDVAVKVTIAFSGEINCQMDMMTCREFCLLLAKNALGIETDELNSQSECDALKEFANMVCGEFIELAEMSNKQLQMGLPHTQEVSKEEWETVLNNDKTLLFKVEDEFPLLATISLSEK